MSLQRYSRQMLLPMIGDAGQQQLLDARVCIIGCGGLGGLLAAWLAGAGVGFLRLVDHDRVALSNLHRQLLYTEADLGQPKATVLAGALASRNSGINIEAQTTMATADALPALIEDVDLVLDCADNFPSRHAINAACVKARRQLLSAAAIRQEGLLLALAPGRPGQACYDCIFPQLPGQSAGEMCEEAGVLGPSVGLVASLQASQAITILLGQGQFNRLWRWDARAAELAPLSLQPDPQCPVCATTSE